MSKKYRSHSSILDSNSEELRRGVSRADGTEAIKDVSLRERPDISVKKPAKNTQKKGQTAYFLFVVGISVLLAVFIIFRGVLNINEGLTSELKVYETDLTGVADGVYTGKYSTAQMSAEVSVSIGSERISAIHLDKYAGIDPQRAQTVIDTIIRYQQLNAPDDSIGGEHTDKIIQRAVMDALSAAVSESGADDQDDGAAGETEHQIYSDIQSA